MLCMHLDQALELLLFHFDVISETAFRINRFAFVRLAFRFDFLGNFEVSLKDLVFMVPQYGERILVHFIIKIMQVSEEKKRLSRQEKKEQKYQHVKLRNKRIRKKLFQKLKTKIKALDPTLKEKYYEIKELADQNQKAAFESGMPVFIDLEYDLMMDDREIRSLALQVSHIMGMNKTLEQKIQLHLTNVSGKQKEELIKQGLERWFVHHYEEGIQDIIESKTFVKEFIYLSPDAEEYLEDVDPNTSIFVVGGFVDRQVQKYMSLNKANALQICSRRLPIEQYIKGNKRPLNIDRVAAILSLYKTHQDWRIAYEKSAEFNVGLVDRIKNQTQAQHQAAQEEVPIG